MNSFTIVADDGEHAVDAVRHNEGVRIAVSDLGRATGWELEAGGLCRGNVCVPVRDRAALVSDDTVDVRVFADIMRRPFVVDDRVDVAVLGASVADRSAELTGMQVPDDLLLRDLDGRAHQWSSLGRKKKLLFAWASW